MQLIAALIVLILPLTLLIAICYINKDKVDALNKLAGFGGIANSRLFPSTQGEYKGVRFVVSLMHPRYCMPLLKVNFYRGNFINLAVFNTKIYFFTRFIKKTGLFNPVKTGDNSFDGNTLIFCKDSDAGRNYLNSPRIKEAIKGFFDEGFERLFVNNRRIFIQKPNYSLAFDLNKEHFEETLERLYILSRGNLPGDY